MSFLIKEAYKQSEFGLIPSDWNVKSFEEVTVEHKQGYYTKEAYADDGVRLLRITDLKNPKVLYENSPFLVVSDKEYEQFKVEPGDFLFARSGAIGRYGIVPNDIPPSIFASYLIRFKFDTTKVVREFLGLFYESDYGQNQISKITQGSSNININANNIKKLKLPLPPLKEQQKIADILNSMDEQIEKTNQLIIKKNELKKGLMTFLFTNGLSHTQFKKTNLGEIPETWNIKKLGDIAQVKTGGTPNRAKKEYWDNGSIPWMSSGEINLKKVFEVQEKITAIGFENSNTSLLPVGTVMMAMNGQGKTRGTVALLYIETTCNQSLAGIIPTSEYNNFFLYYYLEYSYEKLRNITGEGRSGLNLSLIKNFEVVQPSLKEQQKIADILFSVDDQIEIYEKEKEKQIELKKALMQQLLTGKIRITV